MLSRTLAACLLVSLALSACRRGSDVDRCRAGASRSPVEHLRGCVELFHESSCRAALTRPRTDGSPDGLLSIAAGCTEAYCPRFARAPPFCTESLERLRAMGGPTPAEFLVSCLELDRGPDTAASEALREAMRRYDSELAMRSGAHQLSFDQRSVMVVRLLPGNDGTTLDARLPDGGPLANWQSSRFDAADCARLAADARRGSPGVGQPTATIQADRTVPFSVIKCVLSASADAGIEIEFRAPAQ